MRRQQQKHLDDLAKRFSSNLETPATEESTKPQEVRSMRPSQLLALILVGLVFLALLIAF